MADPIAKGTWVEIHRVVLAPGERAPQVPEDTQQVPLEMRVKGFLGETASLGEEAAIVTPAGRHLRGILAETNPAYTHGFGAPIPELSTIGGEVRAVRSRAGLIDVSTLGGIEVRGPDAARFLERTYTFAYQRQKTGSTRYLLMCDDAGAVVDDGVAYRLAEDHFYLTTTTTGGSMARIARAMP